MSGEVSSAAIATAGAAAGTARGGDVGGVGDDAGDGVAASVSSPVYARSWSTSAPRAASDAVRVVSTRPCRLSWAPSLVGREPGLRGRGGPPEDIAISGRWPACGPSRGPSRSCVRPSPRPTWCESLLVEPPRRGPHRRVAAEQLFGTYPSPCDRDRYRR